MDITNYHNVFLRFNYNTNIIFNIEKFINKNNLKNTIEFYKYIGHLLDRYVKARRLGKICPTIDECEKYLLRVIK